MLVGRKEELRILKESLRSDKSEFFAIYGRRRIGKTFLISECFNGKFAFAHAGRAQGGMKKQLSYFYESLRKHGLETSAVPATWEEAFSLLEKLIVSLPRGKKVIFIDELSWMDTGHSGLLAAIEGFWNGWCSFRRDIVLIVCSSAASWIINKIIHDKGGLHNRLTRAIYVSPFTLKECEEFAKCNNLMMSRDQIIEAYMIMGGVPYYWSLLDRSKDLDANIDALFFERNAPLETEFDYLYASLFKKADPYVSLIAILAEKKSGMTLEAIFNRLNIKKSGFVCKRLLDLEHCGFIRKYHQFGNAKKESTYQLMDNFTYFHFKFIKNHPYDAQFWRHMHNSRSKSSWEGFAFERVCLQHTEQIKSALGISGVLTDECAWSCKGDNEKGFNGCQIDLLIVRDDRIINLCEMKYSYAPYSISADDDVNMRNKISDLKRITGTKYSIRPTWICSNGIKENKYSGNAVSRIDLNGLFI